MIVDTATFLACLFALATIVLAIAFLIRSYHADSSSHAKLAQLATRIAVERATSLNTQVILKISTFEAFMEVYSRPLLSLLVDFQALLANQVRTNFLYRATREMADSGRDQAHQDWPTQVFAYTMAEFLAWLEIYRVQSQTMQNSAKAYEVTSLILDIKKQFEEHTSVQGRKTDNSRADQCDELSHIMQLHFGEVQAIGSVMLVYTNDQSSQVSFRVPMPIDEFLRAISVSPPPSDAPYQLQFEWTQSFDHKLQVVLSPMLDELYKLAKLDEGEAPVCRLAIIQVLVCKLIDMLDPGVPWDIGPEYDEGEQRPVVLRDERLTPLVQYLSEAQKSWLSQRSYFKSSDPNLSFPGFRADLASLSQEERDIHPELWPGACPPQQPRRRSPRWRKDHLFYTQYRGLESMYGGMQGLDTDAGRARRSAAASAAASTKLKDDTKIRDLGLDLGTVKGVSRMASRSALS